MSIASHLFCIDVNNLFCQISRLCSRTNLRRVVLVAKVIPSDGDYLNTENDLYVDLKSWLQNLQAKVTVGEVPTQTQKLLNMLTGDHGFILDNQAKTNPFSDGSTVNLKDAYGLSIFYPRDLQNQAFQQYISNQLFSFTANSQWPNFLNGHTTLSPGVVISPVPGPATMLESSVRFQVFLPVVLQ